MWESPINIYHTISDMVTEEIDGNIIVEVKKQLGVDINKDELIKAINYDRNQYEKGYQDGLNADKWIPVSERLPEKYGEYLITWTTSSSKKPFISICECEETLVYNHEHNRFNVEWLFDDYIKCYPDIKVVAWMPLPEPYKAESED